MDPTMFLATPANHNTCRTDSSQIDAFYNEHGTIPLWSRGVTALTSAWHLISEKARKQLTGNGGFAQSRLRMLD